MDPKGMAKIKNMAQQLMSAIDEMSGEMSPEDPQMEEEAASPMVGEDDDMPMKSLKMKMMKHKAGY